MIDLMSAANAKSEKILSLKRSGQYAVGNSLTHADLFILRFKLFCYDPLFNKYGDMRGTFEKTAPTMMKIAEKVEELDVVTAYLKEDGHLPFTGMSILW